MAGWTDEELQACVDVFMHIRAEQAARRRVNKAATYRELVAGPLSERSIKSVELRMRNISSVLLDFGEDAPQGFVPAHNVGSSIRPRIARMLARALEPTNRHARTPRNGKYMRLCWNSAGWQGPTGEAAELENGTYVTQHGFGHEEWLFDWSRTLKRGDIEYQYGFLQPANRNLELFEGKTHDLLLYTRDPDRRILLVARIDGAEFLGDAERERACAEFVDRGLIEAMKEELLEIDEGADLTPLETFDPRDILNVRFRQENVHFFEPRPVVQRADHKINTTFRYMAMNWDDGLPPADWNPGTTPPSDTSNVGAEGTEDPTRSEDARTRAASEGTVYDPRHVRIQNRLYRALVGRYGNANVDYERDYVDLAHRENGNTWFYEVKTAATAKSCIRQALGQLLEYSLRDCEPRANTLVVVGDAAPTPADADYLSYLRANHSIPIYYARFSWQTSDIEALV